MYIGAPNEGLFVSRGSAGFRCGARPGFYGLGTLVGEAQALQARLSAEHNSHPPGASALTAAELRLLPLLTTHLSFSEIAAELFVSPNTAKTHAVSIYRKLGAGSRGQAVARARELGLLES